MDHYYEELEVPLALKYSLFVLFAGCHTWNSTGCDDPEPNGLVATAREKGVDDAAGFVSEILLNPASLFADRLLYHTMVDANSVGFARSLALGEVYSVYENYGGTDGFRSTSLDLMLKPARWGN